MFSIYISIITIILLSILMFFEIYLNNQYNKKILQQPKYTNELNHKTYTEEISIKKEITIIEQKPIKNINYYDFKNSETVLYPIIIFLIIYFFINKFNKILTLIKSFTNTMKTKKLLKKFNSLQTENIFNLINEIEIQLIKNKHLLLIVKNSTELNTYNDLLKSKNESIIKHMLNNIN